MCRSIKVLRRSDATPTDEELYLAARQFVRKVSGYQKPAKANEAIFEETIQRIAATTRHMFDELVEPRPTRPRQHADTSP